MCQNKKIILCHVVTSLGVGGMENGIVNLANNHDREKFKVVICCLNEAGEMAKRLKDDVRLHVLGEKEGFSLMRVLRVAKFFRKIRPDIVHTHAWGGGSFYGILGAKLARVPVVINGEHGTFFTKKYQLILQRLLVELCSCNLAVSETLKSRVIEVLSVPSQKIRVIKNGVDTKKFSGSYSKSEVIKSLRNEGYAVDASAFNIFMVGSLKPVKAQHILLKAVEQMQNVRRIAGLQFFFIGSGPDKDFLQDYARRIGIGSSTFFLGKRSDIHNLFSIAHVLVSTSISEGLSNVLLEAMSSGIPVIATDTGSGEIVANGVNGYLIKEGDVDQLAYYIKKMFNQRDELSRLGENARKIILDDFSISTMVENYENLYFEALGIK